ncbi:aldehyde dehydrogenase family protein [Mycetocola sp. 2940]|uniref:aldehyde dehydrogenase family protein n=1 Tax=Mycetocola sp. 2940 TaxID=3156452 RepID=UPI003395410D
MIDYASTSLADGVLDAAFEQRLAEIRAGEPSRVSNLVGGQEVATTAVITRRDPVVDVAVSEAFVAGAHEVEAAVRSASNAFPAWRSMPTAERLTRVRSAAHLIADARTDIAATTSAETGKTRLEAYGEVQEVVDMIEHYCATFEAARGYEQRQASSFSELNIDLLVPYGVFGVIAPFNFPVALSAGMMLGALITGNTVVLKPSDKAPLSTFLVARALSSVLPDGVLNVVHGGADVGRLLVDSDVDGIAFTGSADVGWQIFRTSQDRRLPRPVLAEMGGHNAAIVASSADVSAAAQGIVRSAFGLSGQKCSACRRVVVDAAVADELMREIIERSQKLIVGDPIHEDTFMGPVIDDAIGHRIDEALTIARVDGASITGGRVDRPGNFFAPTIVSGLPIGHALTREELFAPVLTLTVVNSFEEALAEANATDYGLSAGLFSTNPDEIQTFLNEMQAGVLYVNRPQGATTGAWPGVQSFAGWKRSGSTGKGGLGVHYLQGFMREQSRTITIS